MARAGFRRSRTAGAHLLLLAGLALGAPDALAEERRYLIATAVRQPYTSPDRTGFLDLVVAEMFRRVGARGEMNVYESPERPLVSANEGIDDGTALRIRGLEKAYPHLVRVPEKLLDNDFVAYSLHHEFETSGWSSLLPYHVTYLIGWKAFENNLLPAQQATATKEPQQLFKLLQWDRVDVVLYERWQGHWWAKELRLAVKVMEPPLLRTEMFLYLHERNAALVERLAAALREMKQDGTYRRIFDRCLTPLAGGR